MDTKRVENGEEKNKLQKSYFDVLGLCCSSEVPLIEKILKIEGIFEVSVIVPSRTVIVTHDNTIISQEIIVKALNQARLEANVRVKGKANYKAKWPSPFVIMSGLLLGLSFLKYVYHPLQWLAVGAVAVGIWPILVRGFIALRNFTLDVNILMIIAVICTIVMRDYTEAATIVFLFTIAEWLESRASQKATAVMSSLLSMAPQKATIAETGEVINVEDVKLNIVVAVKAGEMIPVDGVVVEGTCEVDEKTLTGESYPVPKQKDSQVWAGTVNVNGYVSVQTTALAEDSAVAKMARLVEEAQNSRSSVQRLIDRCAKYYTPAVIFISLGVAVIPAILKVHNLRHWFYLALVVLVSACPCGLILSTPVATFCALSRAATTGLLIKGGDYLETLAKIKTIAFDKTGTITRGEFMLMNLLTLSDNVSLSTLLYWVSSIESKSSHPIASVLVDYGRSQSIEPKPEHVEGFQNFPGEGVFGKIDGRDLYIGNKKLAQRAKCNLATNVGGDKKEGATSGYIYCEGVLIGVFHLSDNCRSGAVEAIRELKAMGIRTALLTGDNQSAAMHTQEQLGHALDIVYSELLPENKASLITEFKKDGLIAMVGDGVNDAPALATADVGISMGVSGSALATETGHVILMSNDIRKIPIAIKLARKTRRKVIENIFISIFTKACVLISAIVWHPLVWLAVLADVFTCLIVIFNSMLLLREGHKGHEHNRMWFHLFSSHSHKSKCHSSMNQRCCSKNVPQKTSASEKCASQCCLEKRIPELNKNNHTISESSRCLFHDCSSSWELGNEHVSECHEDSYAHHHQSTCCEDDHCLEALESQTSCDAGDGIEDVICCESDKHETISVCQHEHPKEFHIHESEKTKASSKCHHEHPKELHIHEAEKPKTLSKCQHEHPEELHIHESEKPKTLSKCQHEHPNELHIHESENSKTLSKCQHEHPKELLIHDNNEQKKSDQGVSQQKNAVACKDHQTRPREIHVGHHHHIVQHGACHSHAVANHGRSNLRKREVGACCKSYRKNCCTSQGNFVSGISGLTEIVTE